MSKEGNVRAEEITTHPFYSPGCSLPDVVVAHKVTTTHVIVKLGIQDCLSHALLPYGHRHVLTRKTCVDT